MADPFRESGVQYVAGAEARGFLFAGPLSLELKAGLIPVRKPGKLPGETLSKSYALEYGENTLEIHKGQIEPNSKVLIVDDLLATGGTIAATVELLKQQQAELIGFSFLIELSFLKGRAKLPDLPVHSMIRYDGEN